MSKETDSFLSNECMKAIVSLSIKYPNDMEFGKAVRSFIAGSTKDENKTQIKIPFSEADMGDVNEF